jgi:hypothetical protein
MCWLNYDNTEENHCEDCINDDYCRHLCEKIQKDEIKNEQ